MTETADSNAKSWFFGYGSNMDSDNLVKKKGVKVYQTTPAVLHGYKMEFSIAAITYAEPFFANCAKGEESDSIHGVAFETDWESINKLDKIEIGYDKATVTLDAYDGRKLSGFVYVNKPHFQLRLGNPTARYLALLVNGATAAGLDKDYIARLQAHDVYRPTPETLAKRAALVAGDYPTLDMTRECLGEDPSHFISVYGFIVKLGPPSGFFASHRGRDITNRMVRHFLNLPLDEANDPQDAESLPSLKILDQHPETRDYVWTWFDQYTHQANSSVVGRHRTFLEAHEKSKWTFPTA